MTKIMKGQPIRKCFCEGVRFLTPRGHQLKKNGLVDGY